MKKQQKLLWAGRMRNIVLVSSLTAYLIAYAAGLVAFSYGIIVYTLIALVLNNLGYALSGKTLRHFTNLMIIMDVVGITYVVYLSGGLQSIFIGLFFFEIVAIAVLGNLNNSIRMGALSVIMFSMTVLGQYWNIIPVASIDSGLSTNYTFKYIILYLVVFANLIALTIITSGYLSSKLQLKESQLALANQELSSLYAISNSLSSCLEPEEIINCVINGLRSHLGYCNSMIYCRDGLGSKVITDDLNGAKWQKIFSDRFDKEAMNLNEALIEGTEAYIPIVSKNRWYGLIGIEKKQESGDITPGEIKTLTAVGAQAGVALENAIIYQENKLMSQRDSLTQLYNHGYFRTRLDEEVKGAKRYGYKVCLLMIDIDKFKVLNDTFGHLEGDSVLKELADIISNGIRESDVAARYGGEEFAVILTHTSIETATEIAERLRKTVAEHGFMISGKKRHISVSIGVAAFPYPEVDSVIDLIRQSDKCLYLAKDAGRNQINVCGESTL